MKTKVFLNIFLVSFLIIAAVPMSSAASSPAAASQPATLYLPLVTNGKAQELGDHGSIKYTLDTARKYSQVYDANSGTGIVLTATDANGFGWMLSIPAGALLVTQTISMTPFATIDTSQSAAKIISGVQLEPDGLQFVQAARLSAIPPISNPGIGLIFSMKQDGSDVRFAPTTNLGKMAMADIWHFSAAGSDNENHAGQDGMDPYKKMAEQDYTMALDAARQFIQHGTPTPPTPPSISMFCRGTEVNPENNEAYEFMRYFFEPYSYIEDVLLPSMKNLELVGDTDFDTSEGVAAAKTIYEMAEDSIFQLGNQYKGEQPPDRLYAVINAGLQVEHDIELIGGHVAIDLALMGWGEDVRDYYFNQLKNKHDYRAFPIVMTLNKVVQLLGGNDRMADILSAMTFEVIVDTSFNATWKSQPDLVYATGSVVQHADVKDIKNDLTPPDFLWGTADNLDLKATSGSYTDSTGQTTLDGLSDPGTLYLLNFDACVTKTFDVILSGYFDKDGQNKSGRIAWAASSLSFADNFVDGGFMFTIPMVNLSASLGDKSFSGSGVVDVYAVTGSGQVHVVIKHTPQ